MRIVTDEMAVVDVTVETTVKTQVFLFYLVKYLHVSAKCNVFNLYLGVTAHFAWVTLV